jgi:hypothetical protein
LRKPNLTPLRQVCRACTVVCKPLHLFAGALVALDGSQCQAVNAKARTVRQSQQGSCRAKESPKLWELM